MKELSGLIDKQGAGWLIIQEWLKDAGNICEVLPRDPALADSVLFQLQVTTQSPLGAVIYETGGILVDNGWLRILGSGHPRLTRSPSSWTQSFTTDRVFKALLVADDVSGGFFAINGGEFGEDRGGVYYLAPDSLEWESLDTHYSGFLRWAISGDLSLFYQNVRWENWRTETSSLRCGFVYSFYPFLWTEPQLPIEQRSRTVVSIEEHWLLNLELKKLIHSSAE